MATLEIHEVGQRVRRVRVGRGHPVMIGANPLCDVALADPSVQPYHGRIRWSKDRFKAEVVGEVPYIEVNGTKVKSKGLRQGDEISVGRTRIFLLSVEDDGPEHGEKTVVQEPPVAAHYTPPPTAGAATTGPMAAFQLNLKDLSNPEGEPVELGSDVAPAPEYHKMEMAPPSLEMLAGEVGDETVVLAPSARRRAGPASQLPPRSSWRSRAPATSFDNMEDITRDDPDDGLAADPGAGPAQAWPRRAIAFLRGTDRRPDDDRVFTSPVVLGLAGTFVLLVALSFGLLRAIRVAQASQQFAAAADSYERGDFRAAMKGYEGYLLALPGGPRAGKAKVYRALARVRQHTAAATGSWANAYKEAQAMLGEVGNLPEYRDVSVDLAAELVTIAEGMFGRARDLADPRWLEQGQMAIGLHATVAGPAAAGLLAKSRVAEKRAEAEDAIARAVALKATLEAVDAALAAARPGDAYGARAALLRRYADLAANKELAARLGRINEQVRAAVRFDPSGRPGLTDVPAGALGPPTSLVHRSEPGRPAERSGPVAFALADGWAWGFDSATGAPLWQHAVGLAAPFAPVRVEGGAIPMVLLVDAGAGELACREARSGRLVWRQPIDGRATDPPLVLGARVLQPLDDGRLLDVDLRTGDLRGTLRLGLPIAHGPVLSESGEQAFLLAAADCLFVLALDPLACTSVEFLGQNRGAVACTPARAGRLFVVPENQGLDSGRWRVFVMDATGGNFRQVQEVPIGGWTWGPPVAAGPVIWSASDRGELAAFAVGKLDAKLPLTEIARVAPGTRTQGPAFPLARSDRELVVASGLSGRYDLDADRGTLAAGWTLGQAGHALAPAQVLGSVTVLTQQPAGGRGTALWGVDSTSGAVRWRTVVGTTWPARWAEASAGDAVTTLLNDGRDLTLTHDQLRAGGFVEQGLPGPGGADLVRAESVRLDVAGATVLVPSPTAGQVLVRDPGGTFRPVTLPAPLAAVPLPIGKDLLVPGSGGRVYLVEARSGLSVADPYVPPFDRSRPTRWLAPAAVDGGASVLVDEGGVIRRLVVETDPRPRLAVATERKLDSPAIGDPAATGPAVLIATADNKVRSFAARDLAPLGSWPLHTPPTLGPVVVGGLAFVADATGQVLAFDADGRRRWSATLREPRVAGPPIIRGNAAWFASRDGDAVEALSVVDGASLGLTRLDAAVAGGPLVADTDLVIPTGNSTLQTLTPARGPGAAP